MKPRARNSRLIENRVDGMTKRFERVNNWLHGANGEAWFQSFHRYEAICKINSA